MAFTSAYVSEAEYAADDLSATTLLEAVSRLVDRKTGRLNGFNKDASDTFRLYDVPTSRGSLPDGWAESENPWKYGNLRRVIDIQDTVSVTSVEMDLDRDGVFETTLSTNDYELLLDGSLNATKRTIVFPYNQLGLTAWGAYTSFTPGTRIKLTGKHGWPAVPAQVKVAVATIAGMVEVKNVWATGRIQELDQTVDASPQARKVINDLLTTLSAGIFF